MAAPRDVTPLLSKFRNLLLGLKYKNHLRFEGQISARTQEPPRLPDGVSHKLSANYYESRDARREVAPPEVVFTAGQQLLAAGEEGCAPKKKRPVIPGMPHNWD